MAAPLPGSPLFTPGNTLKETFCTLRLCAGGDAGFALATLCCRRAADRIGDCAAVSPVCLVF